MSAVKYLLLVLKTISKSSCAVFEERRHLAIHATRKSLGGSAHGEVFRCQDATDSVRRNANGFDRVCLLGYVQVHARAKLAEQLATSGTDLCEFTAIKRCFKQGKRDSPKLFERRAYVFLVLEIGSVRVEKDLEQVIQSHPINSAAQLISRVRLRMALKHLSLRKQ